MNKHMALLALTFCGHSVAASSSINSVSVANNIVTITVTDNRTDNLAVCMLAENANKWAFSLTTNEGKNLYRAAIAAHSAGNAVEISPAGDCQAVDGIERPQSIAINLL